MLVAAAVGVLLIALGVWWVAGGSAPSAARSITPQVGNPRLAVQQDAIDLGVQPFERRVSAVFEVRNVGTGSLSILGEPAVELVQGC